MSNQGSNSFWAFLVGALAGAVVGLLYAPDKGKNTRDKLSFQLDKAQENLRDFVEDLVNNKHEIASSAKSEGQKVISDAITQAQQLMQEMEELKSRINSK